MYKRKKWKNKTDEEKEATLLKIRSQKMQSKTYKKSNDRALAIYKNLEIPLQCFKDGFFAPKEYKIRITDLFGTKIKVVRGNCPKCGQPCDKAFPQPFSNESVSFAMILDKLKADGRVTGRDD